MSDARPADTAVRRARLWPRLLPWLVTAACFAWLYRRIAAEAAPESAFAYLAGIFAHVPWGLWLALMIPYSALYFAIDTLVTWRAVRWFNAPVRYRDVLPIRASAYVLSLVNEQVGKGAIALYLHHRWSIPGWEVASSMLFIMLCEVCYLLGWATVGSWLRWDELGGELAIFRAVPWLAAGGAVLLAVWIAWTRGRIPVGQALRERPLLHAFQRAGPRHYAVLVAMRSPALLAAVLVYTLAARLFELPADATRMLAYLPLVFFGAATPGPMRSVAIALWALLYPDHAGRATAFGFVQHNFFILFNAVLGLLFLRRATRELLGR